MSTRCEGCARWAEIAEAMRVSGQERDDALHKAQQVNTLLEGDAATARREAALHRASVAAMVSQLAGALGVPVPGKDSLDPWAELLATVRGRCP